MSGEVGDDRGLFQNIVAVFTWRNHKILNEIFVRLFFLKFIYFPYGSVPSRSNFI
jgi:hypothetical protein